MKALFTLPMFFFPFLLTAQPIDSLVVKEIDSLIQVSRDLTAAEDFVAALEINELAESIAREKLGKESAAYGRCCFNHGKVLNAQGDVATAEQWFLKAKTILGNAQNRDHPDYAHSLNNLANL